MPDGYPRRRRGMPPSGRIGAVLVTHGRGGDG
jgi:hypothetical protein